MRNKKLKLIPKKYLVYKIPVPDRFTGNEITIKMSIVEGEYQYIPRPFTWAKEVRLSIDELQAIIDELKRLNKTSDLK